MSCLSKLQAYLYKEKGENNFNSIQLSHKKNLEQALLMYPMLTAVSILSPVNTHNLIFARASFSIHSGTCISMLNKLY